MGKQKLDHSIATVNLGSDGRRERHVSILHLTKLFKKKIFYLFIHERHREREAETQAEGEAGSMHRDPDVGFDPGSPEPRPGPKAGAKPLRHPGIPKINLKKEINQGTIYRHVDRM